MVARPCTALGVLAGLLVSGRGLAVEPPPARVVAPEKVGSGERRPLVIYLHGLGGSGSDALESPPLRALAERHRMFVVAPDGDRDRQGRRFWNAGSACCNFDRSKVDDVARLTELVDRWRRKPEIDPSRIYVVGFSNGGFMAHRLACRIPDRLAAVVSLAGAGVPDGESCAPRSPLAVLEVHGADDDIVAAGGGRVFDSGELAPHPAATETMDAWARRLGCRRVERRREGTAPRLRMASHQDCRLGRAELWIVEGGGHQIVTAPIIDRVAAFLLGQKKSGAARER